jgi:hypothetical protein
MDKALLPRAILDPRDAAVVTADLSLVSTCPGYISVDTSAGSDSRSRPMSSR